MKRLTKYDENAKCYLPFSLTDWSEIKIMNKLGELEDILESWHIENLEELKTRLHDCQVYHLQNNSNDTLIHNLKNELAKLKQKAIVLEKAFELACNPRDDWGGKMYSGTEFNNYHDYFIAEAEQKLAEIGEKDE